VPALTPAWTPRIGPRYSSHVRIALLETSRSHGLRLKNADGFTIELETSLVLLIPREELLVTTPTMSLPDMGTNDSDSTPSSRMQRSAPVIALVLLAPVIGEVLFGATRITTLFVLLPRRWWPASPWLESPFR
jgi:hypothetical protein